MTRAVLFDLDGTLVDTLHDIADAMNQVLEAAGLPVLPIAACHHCSNRSSPLV